MTALIRPRSFCNRSLWRGFSLVELGVVVAVIGILGGIAIPVFLGQREGAQDAQAKSHVRNVATVARAAAANNDGLYPFLEEIEPDEPSVVITTEPSTSPFEVSGLIESGQVATFAALSESGTCWVMTSPLNTPANWDSFTLEDGEMCGGIFLGGELILSAVVVQSDGSIYLEWEEDPEADYYEVCVDDDCEITYDTDFTTGSGDHDVIRVRGIRDGQGTSHTYVQGTGGSSDGSDDDDDDAPPPPVDDDDEGAPIEIVVQGTTVILTWTDTGTGAEEYEVRRCTTPGCTDGSMIALMSSDGPGEYEHQDDVGGLIAAGVEIARYQVVSVSGIYGAASNWAEVELTASGIYAADCESQTDVSTDECVGLMALYDSIGYFERDPAFEDPEVWDWWWSQGPCDPWNGWPGVTCGPTGVERFSFSEIDADVADPSDWPTGSLPDAIGLLTNLKELDFYDASELGGTLPATIGNLASLEVLIVEETNLTGSIPASIGNLTNLRLLSLINSDLSGSIPGSIGNLTNLEYLYLVGNNLSGSIPSSIGNLTNLEDLDLSGNNLSGTLPVTLAFLADNPWNWQWPPDFSGNNLSGELDADLVWFFLSASPDISNNGCFTAEDAYIDEFEVSWAEFLDDPYGSFVGWDAAC